MTIIQNSGTGVYYFERNREAFGAILYFYQSRGYIERPTCVSLDNFVEEILFFNLDYYVMVFIFKPTFYKYKNLYPDTATVVVSLKFIIKSIIVWFL